MRPCALAVALLLAGCHSAARDPAPKPPAPAGTPKLVYFEDLQPFLPAELAGYALARDEGSTGQYGEVLVSEAEREFENGERRIQVRIVDTTLRERLGTAIRAAAHDAARRDPADPAGPIAVGHSVGFVRFDPDNAKAEANLLVADRFVVAVTSVGFDGTIEVRRVARALDLAGLSNLR